jgi:hypothetical protein
MDADAPQRHGYNCSGRRVACAGAKKLQPARLPLQLDRRAAIAATTDGGATSTITDHAEVTVSVAELDALSGSAYPSAWVLAVE